MITIPEKKVFISSIVTSTIMGHSGGGIFPLFGANPMLWPTYHRLRETIRENGVTNLTKSSTAERHAGNFFPWRPWTWKYIQRYGRRGLVNAYGLTNKGALANAAKIARALKAGYNAIPNFYPQFAKGRSLAIQETLWSIEAYELALGTSFRALELNFSCPNAREQIGQYMEDALACVQAIRTRRPNLCLIGKVSYAHPPEFSQELVKAGADIIHAINTIPFRIVFPREPSPLEGAGGGGVSGEPARGLAYHYNLAVRRTIKAPMIMGCGVTRVDDAKAYFDIGADAVSLCTVCRLDTEEAINIIKKFNN